MTAPAPPPAPEFAFATTNGLRLHYAALGEGPPVVLLHGFPEFWYSWRHQLPALAAAGFRAVAPDLRGWGRSDKPVGVSAYRWQSLVGDVVGLLDALKCPAAHVVGHDWGGILAWLVAHQHPERTRSLTVLNAPHPAGYWRVLARHPGQWLRSWYVLFFQLPWLPEASMRWRSFGPLRVGLQGSAAPGAFTSVDLDAYVANAAQPGALTAGINYYRAAARYGVPRRFPPLERPVQVIWGVKDRFLVPQNAESGRPWAPDLAVHYLEDAGHWLQVETPVHVNARLVSFLSQVP